MKKQLIMYMPLDNPNQKVTHPYQDRLKAEKKQNTLLTSFPSSVTVYIARWEKTHISWDTFQPQFFLKDKKWIPYKWEAVTADLVLWFQLPKWVEKIFNTIKPITLNKSIIEEIFPKYTLQSIICKDYNDIKEKFHKISTDLKVLKPQNGTRSKGIFIWKNIPEPQEFLEENFPYLLQDFFDTSQGFYEFPWLHDFRVVMLNGEIIWKFLRQPEKWTYTANSFRRWGFIDLEDWKIPEELNKIIHKIEAYCAKRFKHRYYSIDFWMWINGELKIFEMNSSPWLTNDRLSQKLWNYITKNILLLDEL